MANVTTLTNIRAQMPYLGDGVRQALEGLVRNLPPEIKASDTLSLYTAVAVHTKVEITNDAGRVFAIIAKSNGTACTVKVYADDADDVTVGTTDAVLSVGVSGTSGDISAVAAFGAGLTTLCGVSTADGLTVAAPATDIGTGAVANDPLVYVLYG